MENEIWKDIKGYEGKYMVSSLGNVKTLRREYISGLGLVKYTEERLLTQHQSYNGYMRVSLCSDGKVINKLVHRLVAEAFNPNPYGLPQVNHKDEDKTNNIYTNLEWCSQEYNNEYGTRNERSAINNRNNPKQNCRQINRYTLDGKYIDTWPSSKEIERSLGFNFANILLSCKKKRGMRYGFQWRYTDECNGTENIGTYKTKKAA